jgi:hypothetical protein
VVVEEVGGEGAWGRWWAVGRRGSSGTASTLDGEQATDSAGGGGVIEGGESDVRRQEGGARWRRQVI